MILTDWILIVGFGMTCYYLHNIDSIIRAALINQDR